MKKTIMLTYLITVIGIAGFSQKEESMLPDIEKKISLSPFDHLTINGNFKVRLIEHEEPNVYIKGNPAFVKAFEVHQGKKNLVVKSKYVEKQADDNQVIITVKNLKTLTILKNAVINATDMLMSETSKVVLESECRIQIKKDDIGKIKATEYFDLEIRQDVNRGSNTATLR